MMYMAWYLIKPNTIYFSTYARKGGVMIWMRFHIPPIIRVSYTPCGNTKEKYTAIISLFPKQKKQRQRISYKTNGDKRRIIFQFSLLNLWTTVLGSRAAVVTTMILLRCWWENGNKTNKKLWFLYHTPLMTEHPSESVE